MLPVAASGHAMHWRVHQTGSTCFLTDSKQMLKGHVCSHRQRCHFDILHPECSVELGRQEKFAYPQESSLSITPINMTVDLNFPRAQHWNSCMLSLFNVGPPCWNYSLSCALELFLKLCPCLPSQSSYFYHLSLSRTEPQCHTRKWFPSWSNPRPCQISGSSLAVTLKIHSATQTLWIFDI